MKEAYAKIEAKKSGRLCGQMIVGTGVDLVSIRRIERVYRRHAMRFLRRVFSTTELALLMARPFPLPSIAARFAAKEAVLKAIGCGIGPASLREVEILAGRGQKPAVRLSGWAARLAGERGINAVELSMAHESPFACAVAIAYRKQEMGGEG
jgi:holo-[acyl-carrier protein] synthase